MATKETLDRLARMALQLRHDLLELVGTGKAGHLGGSASLAEIVAALYFHHLRLDRSDPRAPDRDRFLLSKGHAVLIQYAALVELGYFPRAELKKVKTLGALLQGHPDLSTPGIEAVTGSLGQGLSIGVGMALALRLDRRPSRVYVVMGDGELSEGQLWEAAMAACKFQVDNLVGIVDCNGIQATGPTREVFDIPEVARKLSAFGWHTIEIDGHDLARILDALDAAGRVKGRPTAIIAHTVKGKGFSFAENTAAYHNAALTDELLRKARAELDACAARLAEAEKGRTP